MKHKEEIKLLRMREVLDRTGLSRATIYRKLGMDDFPKPVQLGEKSIAWRSDDLDAWIAGLKPRCDQT